MMNNIGKIIAQRRIELGLSQQYISDVLGYSVQMISKWENGKSFPSLLSWGALAKVLQIDLDTIINGELKSNYNNVCFNNTFSSEKFANNLRRQRKIRDMTQKELAEQLSISYQTLLAWEKGTSFPNVEQFKKLSLVLNLSYDELYFGENNLVDCQTYKKPNEVQKTNKSKKNKMILFAVAFFAVVISTSLATILLNQKLGNKPTGIGSDSANEIISVSFDEKVSDSLNEIINIPFKDNGTLIRPFYDDNLSVEEKEKAVVQIEPNKYVKNIGCDYQFEKDVSISASFSGRVIRIESDYKYYGKCVWVEHASRFVAFYSSLGDISVKLNDEVKSGDVIGTSGTSFYTEKIGIETLHFELSKEGRMINPEKAYGKSIKDLIESLSKK